MSLTAAQRLWFLLNIYKDKEEEAERFLRICQHLRPEAYLQQQEADSISTDFQRTIEEQLGRPLTPEEMAALDMGEIEDVDVDVIERA